MMEEMKASHAEAAVHQNPEHDRFKIMLDWLIAGKAKVRCLV